MNVKETFLSNCEKDFINKAISKGIRHDGRTQYEFRDVNINFGEDYGSVHVCLGETRILAQTTCDVQPPKLARPHEGMFVIYLDLGPMAAPHFEMGRQSELGILVNRALEKCLKDSKVLNLESLCIRMGAKVWQIRLDLNVLNLDGNLVDAASIAAITSLAHFRRPDVSVAGNDITIHDYSDKDPIPLIIQHYPVYVTYAFFNKGDTIIADPTELEDRIADGKISLAINAYKELCGLHLSGNSPVNSDLVMKCATKAAKRAKQMVDLIKEKLKQDEERRNSDDVTIGFNECLRLNAIPSYSEQSISFKLHQYRKHIMLKEGTEGSIEEELKMEMNDERSTPLHHVKQVSPNTAELIRDSNVVILDSESNSSNSDCEIIDNITKEETDKNEDVSMDDTCEDESEEEETVELKHV